MRLLAELWLAASMHAAGNVELCAVPCAFRCSLPALPATRPSCCSDCHGYQPLALGGGDEPQRRFCGPGAGCRLMCPCIAACARAAYLPGQHASAIRLLRAPRSMPWCSPQPTALPPPLLYFVCQCVELDFQYPSEGIHRRWDAGYRITSCAATPDQAAFVLRCGSARWGLAVLLGLLHWLGGTTVQESSVCLHLLTRTPPLPPHPPCSVPKRRPMDETQETLRTSAFPSTHVKEKWAKNLYIAGVAYGRTVS